MYLCFTIEVAYSEAITFNSGYYGRFLRNYVLHIGKMRIRRHHLKKSTSAGSPLLLNLHH